MSILSHLASLVIAGAMSLGIVAAPVQAPVMLGDAVPQTPALFDAYLATGISKTDLSMTLSTGTLRNGQSLSGFMCFVIDINQPTVEYVCGTASGTAVSSLERGVDLLNPNATSSSLAYAHRRFAAVSITDYPTIQYMVRKLNGTDSFESPLQYSSDLATSTVAADDKNLVNVALLNSVAFDTAGVVPASETAAGYVELATGIEQASSTSSGSGARLVLGAVNATSTYNSATAALKVVVTGNSGKIDDNFIANGSPIGSITAYSTSTAPTGWLLADGSAVSRTTYANLYSVIGTSYGSGDGASTFNLPNLTGRTIVMASSTQVATSSYNRATIGATGGETKHVQTIAEIAAHTHSYGGTSANTVGTNNGASYSDGSSYTTSSTGQAVAFNVLDPYLILNYIIKY